MGSALITPDLHAVDERRVGRAADPRGRGPGPRPRTDGHRQERRGESADQLRALPGPRPLLRPRPRPVRRGRRGLREGPRRRHVPPGQEHEARLAVSNCPERAIELPRGEPDMTVDDRFTRTTRAERRDEAPPGHPQRDHHRPGLRLGDRLLPSRARVGRRPVPDPGRPAAALPDRAHRAVRRRLAADALRGRRGDRLRHRALLLAVDHHEQLPAAPRPGAGRRLAADLLRPAVPPRRAQAAAAGVHQDGGQPGRSRRPGRSATRSSTRSRARTSSTPPATTRSTSRCG